MLGLLAAAIFYIGLIACMIVIAAAVPIALMDLEANGPHARQRIAAWIARLVSRRRN